MPREFHAYRLLLIALLCLGFAPAGQAIESVVIDPEAERYELGAHLSFLRDPSNHLDIRDLHAGVLKSAWTDSAASEPVLGADGRTYWLRLNLYSKASQRRAMLLELAKPGIDRVELYVIGDGELTGNASAGDDAPFLLRPFQHRHTVFPIWLEPQAETRLYLKVRSSGLLTTPLTLWGLEAFVDHHERQQLWATIFFGLLLVLILYHSLVLMGTRRMVLLHYIGVLALGGLALFSWSGYGYQFLWSGWPWWNDRAAVVCLLATTVFYSCLTNALFEQGDQPAWLPRSLRLLSVVALCLLGAAFLLPVHYLTPMVLATFALAAVCALAVGIWGWLQGAYAAGFFSLGTMSLATLAVVAALHGTGSIRTDVATFVFEGAFAISALAWALAIARHGRAPSAATVTATRNTNVIGSTPMRRQPPVLPAHPHRATENVDAVTGVRSRQWFDDYYIDTWERALRTNRPFCVMLVEIDGFKNINDHYGYSAGDASLRRIAGLLMRLVPGGEDSIARHGSESFAVLLPDHTFEQAETLGARIQKAAEEIMLPELPHGFALSVSIGVAALRHDRKATPDGLLNAAEDAVFSARSEDREQVQSE